MSPNSHQALHGEGLQGLQGLIYTSHPTGHLTRAVNVVGLHVLGEALLWRRREETEERERGETEVKIIKGNKLNTY